VIRTDRRALPWVDERGSTVGNHCSHDALVFHLQPQADPAVIFGLSVTDGIAHDLGDHDDELVRTLRREATTHEILSKPSRHPRGGLAVRQSMLHRDLDSRSRPNYASATQADPAHRILPSPPIGRTLELNVVWTQRMLTGWPLD
jgi:hypothetical protein